MVPNKVTIRVVPNIFTRRQLGVPVASCRRGTNFVIFVSTKT